MATHLQTYISPYVNVSVKYKGIYKCSVVESQKSILLGKSELLNNL